MTPTTHALITWLASSAGFLAGAWWATRPKENPTMSTPATTAPREPMTLATARHIVAHAIPAVQLLQLDLGLDQDRTTTLAIDALLHQVEATFATLEARIHTLQDEARHAAHA